VKRIKNKINFDGVGYMFPVIGGSMAVGRVDTAESRLAT
jgi:hypothetical protein